MKLAMETCLLNYFIFGDELKSTCDFNPYLFEDSQGIYEVFRVINGKPLFLKDHIDRFYNSAEIGGIQTGIPRNHLFNMLRKLIEVNQLKIGNIQFQFIRNETVGEKFIAWIAQATVPTWADYTDGVKISSLNAIRNHPQSKRVNLPVRQMANKLIAENEIFEVLLFDDNGLISEGSRSNIFFVRGNNMFTSNLELVLPGITRSEVISVALQERINLHTTHISLENIGTYDAAFLTSTSMKVLPINMIDDIHFNPKNNLIERLMKLYDKRIEQDLMLFEWPSVS